MKKVKTEGRLLCARDVVARYYTVCGLLFLLGLAALLFMVVICVLSRHSGSTKMILLLDAAELVPAAGLLICWLQMSAVCKRNTKQVCAAAERRSDGTIRLEYPVEQKRYYLELAMGKRTETAGLIPVWYDERNPRNVFFGSAAPEKASLYGLANLGMLLLLCAAVNAVFFLFLR